MEAGAVVANPNRFNDELLPDGSQAFEVSALQCYYNEVARIGQTAVSTEYDNNPPDEAKVQESGITPSRIQCQVSGYPRARFRPVARLSPRGSTSIRPIATGSCVLGGRSPQATRRIHDRLRNHRGLWDEEGK